MDFLINFIVGAVITIGTEQVAQKPAAPVVPAISASAPSRAASVPAVFIPSTEQMKDKV